jgi:hypothetical protein
LQPTEQENAMTANKAKREWDDLMMCGFDGTDPWTGHARTWSYTGFFNDLFGGAKLIQQVDI